MSDVKRLIAQLDYEAIVIEPEDNQLALKKWETAKRLAEEELGNRPSPEWSYIAGYLSYMLFARGACSFSVPETYLTQALAPGPRQGMARFYLASLYYDTGKLKSAVPHLERVYKTGEKYFKENDQEWRFVKGVEMLMAAHVVSGDWFQACAIGSQLEAAYRAYEDRESMVPLALVGALQEIKADVKTCETLCMLAARIVRLTRSETVIERLFPLFFMRWINASDGNKD